MPTPKQAPVNENGQKELCVWHHTATPSFPITQEEAIPQE